MKLIVSLSEFIFLILLTLFTSCKKETNIEPIPQRVGQVTGIGETLEEGVTATFGQLGGSFQSSDGGLMVSIPAGALAENTTFSIQRISNTNIAAIGQAYRLLPHGIQFSLPVTLTFTYDDADFEETTIHAVGVSYQDDEGVWQAIGASHNELAHSFSVATTHFSDWSLFKSLEIHPLSASLEPNQSLTLRVVNFMSDDELIPPLPGEEKPIGPMHDVSSQLIQQWHLGGAGVLVPNGNEAVYTAPSEIPTINPVAVSVSLNGPDNGQYLLVSSIYIGGDGITFRINNGPWLHGVITQGGVQEYMGYHNLDAVVEPMVAGEAYGALSIKWTGYPTGGNINWGLTVPWFNYSPNGGNTSYHQYNIIGSTVVPSQGGITFSHYSETVGGDIIGSFVIETAGKQVVTGTSMSWSPVLIEGFFKTKRI